MDNIDWGLTAKAIIWIILGCVGFWLYILFASWVGQKLHALSAEYPTTSEHDQWVAENEAAHQASQELLRLKRLIALADEFDAAPTDKEFRAIYRKAQALGLAPEDEFEPFHLDSDDQPRRSA